jgi:hypothetical protein
MRRDAPAEHRLAQTDEPFELEIHGSRLTDAGLILDPQYGVSAYRLDFAVQHPDLDGTAGHVRHPPRHRVRRPRLAFRLDSL